MASDGDHLVQFNISRMSAPYEDPMMITNLTAWEDIESLRRFTYETVHR